MQLKFFEETKTEIKQKKKIRKKLKLNKLTYQELIFLQKIMNEIVFEYEQLLGYSLRNIETQYTKKKPPVPPPRSSSFNLL